jgi:hypothetical protein
VAVERGKAIAKIVDADFGLPSAARLGLPFEAKRIGGVRNVLLSTGSRWRARSSALSPFAMPQLLKYASLVRLLSKMTWL